MKRLITTSLLLVLFTACDINQTHYQADKVSQKQSISADLSEVARVSGFKKVEYELIKEDLTGDPFKIKLYLYSGNRSQNSDINEVSKVCAATFLKTASGVQAYKLIEVNLIGDNGETAETIFYTSKLTRI